MWVDHESFLAKVWGKTGSKLYSKVSGADYVDNLQVTRLAHIEIDVKTSHPRSTPEDKAIVTSTKSN